MADALVWMLIKDNNCFLRRVGRTKRSGAVQFSSEPGNLMAVNSFKYSGLANSKTIDLSVKDQTISMSLRAPKKSNQPKKNVTKIILKKCVKPSVKLIKSQACSNFYRADLTSAAINRYKKLYRDVRIKKGVLKAARSKAGRNSRSA